MSRDVVFKDLVRLVEKSGREVDTSKLALDDSPFWVHGIDSLTLVRLIGDVERTFGIELEDSDALVAYSFERLVNLIITRTDDAPRSDGPSPRVNLLDVLHRRAQEAGGDTEVRLRSRRGDDVALSHEHLLRVAAHVAQGIPEPVDERPVVVLVAATDPLATLVGFLAALTAEALPLVLPPAKTLGGYDAYYARIHRLAAQLGRRPVVALEAGGVPDRHELAPLPVLDLPGDLLSAAAVDAFAPASSRRRGGDDVAFLQMTSASTGDAKLVAITHANVCSNLDAMLADLGMQLGTDRCCSWLPLHHDMGLIGAALFPLYGGFSTVLMRPNDFIKDPARWLRTISEFRATFSGAPNFALDYAATMVRDEDLEGVDLSSIRRFGLAAEPIHRATVQTWLDRFGPFGFRAAAMVPGLGMAESTLSTTTRVGAEPRYVVVEAAGTVVGEPVRVLGSGVCSHPATVEPDPARPGAARGVAVFSLGTALAGLEVDLRDEDGKPLTGEHVVGEICVTGTSVAGYYDAGSGRQVPPEVGVLHSGDLGFFDGGELFVLERLKNVVIRNGANHLASLLEQQVADVLGVQAQRVLILDEDIHDAASPVHVIVELADGMEPPTAGQALALRGLDLPVDVVTLARGFALPRTTSGKKQYHLARRLVAEEAIDAVHRVDLR